MARLTSAATSIHVGSTRSVLAILGDTELRWEPHLARIYDGRVGRRTRAIRAALEGTLPLNADCCQISVYSSPRVCTASEQSQRAGKDDGFCSEPRPMVKP